MRHEVRAEGLEGSPELGVVRGGRQDSRETREALHGAVLHDVPGLSDLLRRDVAAREARELGQKFPERRAGHLGGHVGAGGERAGRAPETETGGRPVGVPVLLPQILVQPAREATAENSSEKAKLRPRGIREHRRGGGEPYDGLRRLGAVHDEEPLPARPGWRRRDRNHGRFPSLGFPVAEGLLERAFRLGGGEASRDEEGREVGPDERGAFDLHALERDRLHRGRRTVDGPGVGMPVAIERAAHDPRGDFVRSLVGLGEVVE